MMAIMWYMIIHFNLKLQYYKCTRTTIFFINFRLWLEYNQLENLDENLETDNFEIA